MPKNLGKQHKILKTLNTLDYRFEGAMIPYILLKDTAKQIKGVEDLDNLDRLEIGVYKHTLNRYARHTLRDWLGKGWANKEHIIEGTPVYIQLIKKRWGFFKYLDKIPYWGGTFHIANPFDKYWKSRNLVK